ncbi:MAG: PSD1 and planctomycete cytochrome C domain-containing protein [Bryobacterales bacterium]
MIGRLACLVAACAAALCAQNPAGVEYFEKYIRPVLAERCYACHSGTSPQPMGALRLDTREGIRQGGNSGPAVVEGEPGRSVLLRALRYDDAVKMPPGGKLPDEEIARFEEWIRMGAADPREGAAKVGRQLDPNHWAFRPVAKQDGTIDGFVNTRLASEGLQRSTRADKRTALRRLYVDLNGIAPTADEIEEFEASESENAWEEAVDRLLASQRFGERWGRHWLDVARYSDEGFQAKPFAAAWTYRKWVIDAFNEDMPYDRFVLRQLAADLLPDEDRRHLAALGFLRVGINLPRPTDVPENLDDRIDVVTRGLLGLSVACARCHDHKFDPIPQKDYYSLYGVFLNSEDVLEPAPIEPLPAPGYYAAKLAKRRESIDAFKRERLADHEAEFRKPDALEQYIQAARDSLDASNTKVEKLAIERNVNLYLLNRWRSYLREHPELDQAAVELAGALSAADRAEAWDDPAKEKLRLALRGPDAPTNVPFEDFWWIQNEGDSNTVKNLTWQYFAVMSDWGWRGGPAHAMTVRDAARLEPARVFVRGNQHDKGAEVPRKFLTALGGELFDHGSGRLELARVIADADNPLTARVMANRVWQHLFGYGLVRTPSDFGTRGDPPTHPELLDWLASRFVESGWSVKDLHRQILYSNAYRMQSRGTDANAEADPDNKLLSHMPVRRLEAEAIRDSLLAVAGTLSLEVGGESVPPHISAYQDGRGKPESGPLDGNGRRSIYIQARRNFLTPLFLAFDYPQPFATIGRRGVSAVPSQALMLLNTELVPSRRVTRWSERGRM